MPLPDFPEWGDDAYRLIKIPQYDWHCSAARRVENFVDFSHFAWVHEGILGDRSRPEIPDHDVYRTDTTLWFRLGIEEPANDLKGDTGATQTIQRDPSHYTITMPFTVRLDQPLEDDRHFVLFVASCPLSAKETRNFTWNARNYELDPAATRASSTSSRSSWSRTASSWRASARRSSRSTCPRSSTSRAWTASRSTTAAGWARSRTAPRPAASSSV